MSDIQGKIFVAETVPSCFSNTCNSLPSIGKTLLKYIQCSTKSIAISSIYTSLLNDTGVECGSDELGRDLYQEIVNAANRGVKIRILLTTATKIFDQAQAENLKKLCPDKIFIGYLDIKKITKSDNGIQHSKLFIFDERHFYVGSANCDWRAYSEVVEIGIFCDNSPIATSQILQIFDLFWAAIDETLFENILTEFVEQKGTLEIGEPPVLLQMSISPTELEKFGYQSDLTAIQNVINSQKEGVLRLCAMEYSNYEHTLNKTNFWGEIDYLLRKATMERDIDIHILIDEHETKKFLTLHSLQTLQQYKKIYVKAIKLPPLDPVVPFTRLFHAKMCIGEEMAWISTNNLTPNYFINCAGVGTTISGNSENTKGIIKSLQEVYDKYYLSEYSTYIKL